jgi:hypothetical protein
VLLVIVPLMVLMAGQLGSTEAQATSGGVWQQTGVDVFPKKPEAGSITTYAIGAGSSRKTMSVPETGDLFESMGTWNSPATTYKGGELVELEIQLKIVTYVRNADDDGYIHPGLNHVGDNMSVRIDAAGIEGSGVTGGAIGLADSSGNDWFTVKGDEGVLTVPSAGGKVSAVMPTGSSTGELIAIYVSTDSGTVRYTYTWVAEGDDAPTTTQTTRPTTTTIPLSGDTLPPGPTTTQQAVSDPRFSPENDSGARFSDLYGQVEVCFPTAENADGTFEYDDEDWTFAKLDMVLPYGTKIKTSERSGAIVSFPSSEPYVFKPDTCVAVDGRSRAESQLKLLWGTLYTNAKHIWKYNSFPFEAGQAVAGGRGTAFVVEDDEVSTTVKVIEGAVEMKAKADGATVLLQPGEKATATAAGLGAIEAFDAEAEQADWDEYMAEMDLDLDGSGFPLWALILIIVVAVALLAAAVAFFLLRRRKHRPYPLQPLPAGYAQAAQPAQAWAPASAQPAQLRPAQPMTTDWYYADPAAPGGRVGPFTWEQLFSLAQIGKLLPTSLIWHPSLHQWVPAGQYAELFPGGPGPGD